MGRWENIIVVIWLAIILAWGILSKVYEKEIAAKLGLKNLRRLKLHPPNGDKLPAILIGLIVGTLLMLIIWAWIRPS